MRACPFCAEQIQNAAIICRYCGREVLPLNKAEPSDQAKPKLPSQSWYAVDERIKRPATREDRKPRPSIWAKIGGALAPSELRPGRPGHRETMVREYANVRRYQADVDKLVRAGWVIDQQVDRTGKIVVRWFREPSAEAQS